ncbi:capsid staple protein [Serratia fonticola]|uniref:capsid staple protein n=1 Tax=Serratia fonticola TaxID=47917 RepID=UPI003AAF0496
MKTVNLKIGTDTYESEGGKPEARDEYPWGLRFTLNNDTLEKLGIPLPKVGEMLAVGGIAKVLSVSTRTEGDKAESSVDLQFTDLGVEAAPAPQRSAADTLYGDTGGE